MRMFRLSPRLAAVAAYVRVGKNAADVGCDHGYLAAWLAKSGKCPQVIATDINEKPLEKAKNLFSRLNLNTQCHAVCTNGLVGICPDEVDDVIIAGLGGDIISEIIDGTVWLRDDSKQLILCPTTHASRLRRWLYQNGFCIVAETPVIDGRFCYSVMNAAYCGKSRELMPGEPEIGLVRPNCDAGKRYIAREIKRAEDLLNSGAEDFKREYAADVLKYIDGVCGGIL